MVIGPGFLLRQYPLEEEYLPSYGDLQFNDQPSKHQAV